MNSEVLKEKFAEIISKFKKIKNKKQIALLSFIVLCVIIIGSIFYSNVIHTSKQYKEAVSYYNEYNFEKAKPIFKELGDYKDSKKYVKKCSKNIFENDYNHALALYEKGEYKEAMEILDKMPDYNGSKQFYEQCRILAEQADAYAAVDPQNKAYYDIVQAQYKKYGKPKVVKTAEKRYAVTGVNLLELIDFNNDGINEMVIGRRTSSKSAGKYEIYAYYGNTAHMVYSADYSSYVSKSLYAFKTAKTSDSDETLLYVGTAKGGKTLEFNGFKFSVKDAWKIQGKSYLLNKKTVTKKKYNASVPNEYDVIRKNTTPVDTYTNSMLNAKYYATSQMKRDAASWLCTSISNTTETLRESKDR